MDWPFVAILVGGVLLLNLLVHLVYARICQPHMERLPPFHVPPSFSDNRAEVIEFPTSGGLTLRGSLHRQEDQPSRGLILFCPEMLAGHWSASQYCSALREAGFDVLAFDFRNQGESDFLPGYEPLHWLTDYEVEDVHAALNYIASRDDLGRLPLGVFGVSRGGCAALAAAATRPEVRRIAAQGVQSTRAITEVFAQRWMRFVLPVAYRFIPAWHLRTTLWFTLRLSELRRRCRYTNLERLLPQLADRPVMLIAGGADNYIPSDIPRRLCHLMGRPESSLWIVPKAKHNQEREIAGEEYDRRLVEFFAALDEAPPSALTRAPSAFVR